MEQKIIVEGQFNSTINFAMQQNYVPIFRNLILKNTTELDIENVRLKITFDPDFAHEFVIDVPRLAPNTPIEISPVRISISSEYLFSITEKVVGNVHIEAFSADECIYSAYKEIELLAYDEWSGALIIPEIITAFITPNHPKVTELVSKASLFLQKWNGSPSFTGYQSKNPNIAKIQAAAIYAALQAEGIAYNMPPASYEKIGQRVRLPNVVLEQKSGTCLDLSVLFAACLEAVGLNPLIVFIKGHAFSGLWLEEDTFAECVEDDISAITKRTADGIDTIFLVECTDYVLGKGVDFDKAGKHADDNLLDPSEFDFVIDVRRCRGSGIRPVPTRLTQNGQITTVDYGKREKSEITSAPKEINLELHGLSSEKQEVTRKTIWERKLLDLSLRNSLLNFRPASSNIQFMTADLSKLEDEISRGEDFKIMSVPNDFTISISDSKIYEIENEKDLVTAIAEAEFKSHRLRTFIPESELEKTLKKLHRQAKISIEENGANTLYLALGFLRWFETEKSERPRFAPLVLIPVDIIQKIQDRSYSIRIRDEEIQMNITLLELLRQDFGINIAGLNPLPQDESGIDLPLIFNTVRQGIMSKKHWDIEQVAFIGQFSFNQFIMWNDIRSRAEDLKKNKVVASLISGKLEWTPEDITITSGELDEKVSPCDMAVPTSADSSQLAAIYEASCGQSFVLHGPPGTGKSQTITNMIANALYNGKSVLFVAEKMAALSVVQKRLAAIGLDPFCLELHSNKAQKKSVLKQLEATLAVGHIKPPSEYHSEEVRLHSLRCELNSVMNELYKKRSIGVSVYDAITELEKIECDSEISFETKSVSEINSDEYVCWTDAVRKVSVAGNEYGSYVGSPLKNCHIKSFSPELKEQLLQCARETVRLIDTISVKNSESELPLPKSYSGYTFIMNLINAILSFEVILADAVCDENIEAKKAELELIIAAGNEHFDIFNNLSVDFEQSVWSFDADTALLKWKQTQQKWFLPKLLGTNKLLKEINLYSKNGNAATKENIVELYRKLSTYKQLGAKISSAPKQITDAFGSLWMGESSDFSAISKALNNSYQVRTMISECGDFSAVAEKIALDIIKNKDVKAKVSESFPQIYAVFTELSDALSKLENEFGIDKSEIVCDADFFTSMRNEANVWIENIDDLKPRVVLENALDELKQIGLNNVYDAYISGAVDDKNIISTFRKGTYKAVISAAIKENSALAQFQGAQFEDTINKYRETAKNFELLTIQELVSRLSAKIPSSSSAAGSSEISVLQKAIRSGGRMMPIRKLFDSIPNLLRRICPCMLMSPISVAQYIDTSFPKFDLVIFDEASQMPTCEAVGAIARGDNVVVVGDPKQLPPTSFFASNQVDEENIDKEDLESVLDDCLALTMPQKHLLWHYRSRHESLIAYSNAKFYDNKLFTFPSPDDIVSDVEWVNVDGFYDKGGTKQNKAEAEAIIREIVRRLSDEELRHESIGVVTFSVVQQILIDDMLSEELCRNPQLESWANEMYEPILVKNLENVQGDERDVILFSIGYGPDKNGNVSMNFGPLNRGGGWRRLNVAISRARKRMKVYSVITPEQIDMSRTRSDGVAALKGFLEFAAKGRAALPVRLESGNVSGDGFEKNVADAIKALGYDVRCNIGSSEYKIDIGVVNPENEKTYILGVLCGNKRIFEATTARDRNILQPNVLSGLGWGIYNVHILDWYDNRQKCIERLKLAIDEAVKNYRENPTPHISEEREQIKLSFEKEDEQTVTDKCTEYKPYQPSVKGTPERFYEVDSKSEIIDVIREAVATEAPVSRKTVLKYVLASWGISRSGSRVEAVFDSAVNAGGIKVSQSNGTVFFWKDEQNPTEYKECRISGENVAKRSMDDICSEEICNGMLLILSEQISIQRSDMIRESAKLFGYTRTGGIIESSAANGFEYALANGKILCENDRVILKTDTK